MRSAIKNYLACYVQSLSYVSLAVFLVAIGLAILNNDYDSGSFVQILAINIGFLLSYALLLNLAIAGLFMFFKRKNSPTSF
ncbi:MAG: hypothetical protein WBA16_10280 [Nonlabens sp.]